MKLTAKEYQLLIARSLVAEYGSDLMQYNTDLEMAAEVVKTMKDYLIFIDDRTVSQSEFEIMRRNMLSEYDVDKNCTEYQNPPDGLEIGSEG